MKNKVVIPAEQGDVTLIDASVPLNVLRGAKKRKPRKGRIVLALGEATGHHHSLDSERAYILDASPELNKLFNTQVGISPQANILDGVLVVTQPDTIVHQEHAPIEISEGVRWIVIEQEYTPQRINRTID